MQFARKSTVAAEDTAGKIGKRGEWFTVPFLILSVSPGYYFSLFLPDDIGIEVAVRKTDAPVTFLIPPRLLFSATSYRKCLLGCNKTWGNDDDNKYYLRKLRRHCNHGCHLDAELVRDSCESTTRRGRPDGIYFARAWTIARLQKLLTKTRVLRRAILNTGELYLLSVYIIYHSPLNIPISTARIGVLVATDVRSVHLLYVHSEI